MKTGKTLVSSLIDLPTNIDRNTEEYHFQTVDLIKWQIQEKIDANNFKVDSIKKYIGLLEQLDVSISSVINSQQNCGDVDGTIKVLTEAIREWNDKMMVLTEVNTECEKAEIGIESLKLDIKRGLQLSRAYTVAGDQQELQNKYIHDSSEQQRIK